MSLKKKVLFLHFFRNKGTDCLVYCRKLQLECRKQNYIKQQWCGYSSNGNYTGIRLSSHYLSTGSGFKAACPTRKKNVFLPELPENAAPCKCCKLQHPRGNAERKINLTQMNGLKFVWKLSRYQRLSTGKITFDKFTSGHTGSRTEIKTSAQASTSLSQLFQMELSSP